jgi:hypothetical protein
LVEWSDLETPDAMMKTLTSTLAIPKRLSETEANNHERNGILRIGNMVFLRPDMSVWKIAQKTAEDLQELVADFSLGIKNKFYRKLIEQKANHAIKKLHYTTSTVDMTAKVSKVLLNAKNLNDKLECSRFRKDIVKSTVDKLLSMNKAMKNTSAALKSKRSKNENSTEIPNATSTHLKTAISPVTKNKDLNVKTQSKNNSNKQKTTSNIQNDAANKNKNNIKTQQQVQIQEDDNSTNTQSSHNVAATMRQQRREREQEQNQQQNQQQYNQQYQPPPPQYQYEQHYDQHYQYRQ